MPVLHQGNWDGTGVPEPSWNGPDDWPYDPNRWVDSSFENEPNTTAGTGEVYTLASSSGEMDSLGTDDEHVRSGTKSLKYRHDNDRNPGQEWSIAYIYDSGGTVSSALGYVDWGSLPAGETIAFQGYWYIPAGSSAIGLSAYAQVRFGGGAGTSGPFQDAAGSHVTLTVGWNHLRVAIPIDDYPNIDDDRTTFQGFLRFYGSPATTTDLWVDDVSLSLGVSPPPEYRPAPQDWYVNGMTWTATAAGALFGLTYEVGAKITARGDGSKVYLPPSEVLFVVTNPAPTGIAQYVIADGPPSEAIQAQFNAGVVNVRTRVDIYEMDNVTPWQMDVAIQSGSVSVDASRSERRNLDIVFDDEAVQYGPNGGFWYDKIIRPYRGIRLADGTEWLYPLGQFFVDSITRARFPATVAATCRDRSKMVIFNKFENTETFTTDYVVTDVIQAIAAVAGVFDIQIESNTATIPSDVTFKYGDDRWQAILQLAASISYEAYFDAFGLLIVRPWVDPETAATTHTFQTGAAGNLIDFTRVTNDTFLRNDIIVHGDGEENPFVFGRAENTNDATPTSIGRVGRRTEMIPQQYIADDTAATALAQSILAVSALEQYDVSLGALVIPWLEAGDAVEAVLPDSAPTDPTRFLLSNFSIPLAIGSMEASAKRVTNLA